MRKIKLIIFIITIFGFFEPAYTFELPTYNFSNTKISTLYNTLNQKINKYFADKINILDEANKNIFNSKIIGINKEFQNLDNNIQSGKKEEARLIIKKLKKDIIDLIIFLKQIKKPETKIIINNNAITNLNSYSNNSQKGDITYYSDVFEGLKTANGDIFSQDNFSAAKCDIPFGTMIQIWLDNKSIITKINDRPNCYLYPDLIDLTTTSFDFIYRRYVGKKSVDFVSLGQAPKGYTKTFVNNNFFENIGITLDGKIPNSYLKNESIHINGKTELSDRFVTFVITFPSGKKIELTKKVETYFSFSYNLEEVGEYKINFVGNEKEYSIFVLEENVFTGKKFIDKAFEKIEKPQIIKEEIGSDVWGYRIVLKDTNYHMIKISQGQKNIFYSGIQDIVIPAEILEKEINIVEQVRISISTSATITGFSHDFYTNPQLVFDGEVLFVK